MKNNTISRRTFGGGSLAAVAVTMLGATNASAAGTTRKFSEFGGATSSGDNLPAFQQALQTLAPGDTLIFDKPGTYNFSSPLTLAGKRVILDFNNSTLVVQGPHVLQSVNPGDDGSVIKNFTAKCGSSTGIYVATAHRVQISGVTLLNPQYVGIQVMDNANAQIVGCRIYGDGRNSGQTHGIYGGDGHGVIISVSDTYITGCWRGIYTVSLKSLVVNRCTINAFWWHMLPLSSAQQSTIATSNTTGGTVTTALAMPSSFAWATNIVTAYEKVGTGSLTRVGTTNWYTISGLSGQRVEPRLVITSGNAFGTVVEAKGNQVRVDMWFNPSTRHMIDAPSSVSGATFETPYIGVNREGAGLIGSDGKTLKVERWMVGGNARNGQPPAGSRVVISQACDYQVFSVKANNDSRGTDSYSASYNKVYNSYADTISSIGNVNTRVSYNELYDGEDVGITLQWGTGVTESFGNKIYRMGSAGIFVGSSNAVVKQNEIYGAQYIAVNKQMYGAIQVEGADSVVVSGNKMTNTGSPWEVRGLLVEGRYGAYAYMGPDHFNDGPFPMNGTYENNVFVGYPQYDVTFQGPKSSTKSAIWNGARIEYLEGATSTQAKA